MARQTETERRTGQLHVGVVPTLPFNVLAYSLSEAICAVGIPTLEIGLAAASQGLVTVDTGEGMLHFTWNKAKLDKHSVKFLEAMLINLREAAGESSHAS